MGITVTSTATRDAMRANRDRNTRLDEHRVAKDSRRAHTSLNRTHRRAAH